MLNLKLQYFGNLMQRTDSLEKTLMLGKTEDWRRRGNRWDGWMTSPTCWTWVWASSGSWWWTGRPGMQQSVGSQRVGHDWMTELSWIDNTMVSARRTLYCLTLTTILGDRYYYYSPFPLYSGDIWGSEKLSNLPTATQLGGARITRMFSDFKSSRLSDSVVLTLVRL